MRRLVLLALLAVLTPSRAEEQAVQADARDAALAKAFRYLDEELWKLQDGGSPRRQYTMAVAGWAYLLAADKAEAGRKLPGRKRQIDRIFKELVRYTERVERLYEKDDKRSRKKKAPPAPGGFGAMRTAQYVWPLSVAAHFFAESAARGKRKGEAKKALKAIAKVLAAAQQENGGWGHDDAARPGMGLPPIRIPKPGGGDHTYPATLLAASHCALSALGVAHRTLKTKRAPALQAGREYFRLAQNGNGSFPYDPSQKHGGQVTAKMAGGIETARTAGAVFALFCAGAARDDPVAVAGLKAIDAQVELLSEGHGSATMALQFGALLSRGRGDRAWAAFREIFLPRILAHQEPSGAFTCVCQAKGMAVTCDTRELPGLPAVAAADWIKGGKVYVTAIHALILLLDRTPARALPEMPDRAGPVTPPG